MGKPPDKDSPAGRDSARGSKGREGNEAPAPPEDEGKAKLDQAYEGLEREAPDWLSRCIRWLRNPSARWVRLPLGIALVVSGFFGFLPVVGYEFIPVGLLLIAQDLPFMRKPVAEATLWLERKWMDLRRWWRARRGR
jgi:hypothetical protein